MKGSKHHVKSEKTVLAVVTFSHFAQHFLVGLSILYPEIMVDLKLNYTQLGIATGVGSTISGFLQMAWSILARYSPRRVLLGFGNLLMSIGSSITGAARGFLQLLGGNVVGGGGQAAQHPIGTSIVTDKYPREKASGALSIHYGLGYVGNIISPVILSTIAGLGGWRLATYFLATIPLMTGLSVLYFLKGEESASKSVQDKGKSSLWKDIKTAVRIRSVILIMAAQAFAIGGTGMGVIITYTPLFLKNILGLGSFETSIIYSIAVAGGVLGTITFGQVARRFGNLITAATIIGSCSLLILLLTFHGSPSLILVLQLFIIGATSFSTSSLLQAHLASISTPRQRDILLGLFFTVGFGISSVWTTLTGFLIDTFNSFNPAWIFRAALGAIAFSLIILAARTSGFQKKRSNNI